ncbi:MAG: sugar phosphate nucleotidyltransferase [Nocardioidaceae bacterium]
MARDRVVAVVLAGGQGSRMDVLTRERAKPAMPFGGVYQLVDFPLSNLHHSRIEDVWLSVQYQSNSIADQVANGRPWDLDRTRGGLRLLPPQQGVGAVEDGLATGNADVLFRQRDIIWEADPDLLVVLSADHVYRFDLNDAIDTHRAKGADCTVVTSVVPREQAGNHATVTANRLHRVTAFDHKPARPRTGVVATEIFVYRPSALIDTLEQLHRELDGKTEDEADDGSGLGDFGHHLLPRMVEQGSVYEHRMPGYWKDVGRPESYFAAHRDLLMGEVGLLDEPGWPILTRDLQRAPTRIRHGARVAESMISPGCRIEGTVRRSVLGPGVVVEPHAVVSDSIVLADSKVGSNARVMWSIIDSCVRIEAGARLGGRPAGDLPTDDELTLVGRDATIGQAVTLGKGARLEPGTVA